jgi:hypothetical protein
MAATGVGTPWNPVVPQEFPIGAFEPARFVANVRR